MPCVGRMASLLFFAELFILVLIPTFCHCELTVLPKRGLHTSDSLSLSPLRLSSVLIPDSAWEPEEGSRRPGHSPSERSEGYCGWTPPPPPSTFLSSWGLAGTVVCSLFLYVACLRVTKNKCGDGNDDINNNTNQSTLCQIAIIMSKVCKVNLFIFP